MDKYKKLLSNSFIFFIGNFGSKLISILMVPLYTKVLTPSEYGVSDLILTTINLLVPILTLELGQAAIRFAIDAKSIGEKESIYSSILFQGLFVSLISFLMFPIISYFKVFGDYNFLFLFMLIMSSFNNMLLMYIRGIGKVIPYALNGILTTLITVGSNLLLLLVLKMGIQGYLISMIIAYLVSNVYLMTNANSILKNRKIDLNRSLMKEMLSFSTPLVPNTIIWWLINGSTRYFILYFVGASGNGLYAVANKVPSIISVVTTIFTQAWQISSFEEFESKEKDSFYTNVFNIFLFLIFLCISVLIMIIKPIFSLIIDPTYFESWKIAPFLILGVGYSSLSAFLGTNYTAAKSTRGTFYSSIIGGVTSIISNILLIPTFGVIGSGIGNLISFVIMFLYRLIDTKRFVKIKIDYFNFLIMNLMILVLILGQFYLENRYIYFLDVIVLIVMLGANLKLILSLGSKFKVLIRGKNESNK